MIRRTAPDRAMSTLRVEAYTDAVFAIAATLLVLDLTAESVGEVGSDGELWAKLAGMWPSLLSFGVSFALLSLLWMIHVRQFRDIVRVDTALLWLNSARLLFIVLIPFTTSLVADYSDFYAGRLLLPVNFFLAALLGHLSWRWAAARGGHLMRPESVPAIADQGAGSVAAVVCGGIAAIASPWLGSWAFFAYALNGPLTALLQRRARSAAGAGHEAADRAGAASGAADRLGE